MLAFRRAALRSPCFCRSLASYSPKVYAYPFKVSQDQAIQQLAPVVGGIFHRLHAASGQSSRIPEQIVPVYFPAWFIDAEVEATVTAPTASKTKDGRVTAVSINSYLPGHTWDKLSSISLLSPKLADNKAVPFSSDMDTQHGAKITCLPFQTSPLSVLDAARSLQPTECVYRNLRLDPSSIRTNLISAYPVLIPLYLAKYKHDRDDPNDVHDFPTDAKSPVYQTVVLEAYDEMGRIIVENVDRYFHPVLAEVATTMSRLMSLSETGNALIRRLCPSWMWDQSDRVIYRGFNTAFGNISALTLPPRWYFHEFHNLGGWLDGFLTAETLKKLGITGDAKMDDPRIRPLTDPELEGVRKFIALGQERSNAHNLLNVSRSQGSGNENAKKEVKDYAASLDAQREKAVPRWWSDWQKSITK